jgi:protein ImuA
MKSTASIQSSRVFSGQPNDGQTRGETILALQRAIRQWEGAGHVGGWPWVSSGCAALDRLLPDGGFRRGTLIEWLGAGLGSGAGLLALLAAREALRDGGPLVVIDPQRTFYPPAVLPWGIEVSRLILVHPASARDAQWSLDQVLRSGDVGAVLAWPERLDSQAFRRLQLAADQSGGLALLVRHATARAQPSWAAVRWLVRPQASAGGWRLHVEPLRLPGGLQAVAPVLLELDLLEGTVREVESVGRRAVDRTRGDGIRPAQRDRA